MNKFTTLILLFFLIISRNINAQDIILGQYIVQGDPGIKLEAIIDGIQFRVQENGVIQPPRIIKVKSELSERLGIWFIDFQEDFTKTEREYVLNQLRRTDGIKYVEYNRTVSPRYIQGGTISPNDPKYYQQWHLNSASDKDIDAPEAWFKTTGGQTNNGDRIVVAVIEPSGAEWYHPDLIGNHWTNENETDNDGIDNDNNGYVDDYHGWNPGTNSDYIANGTHGTGVSGMIGAVGNNGTDKVGVNWDVDIMQIQLSSTATSSVIAAYSYAYEMRSLYNETNGAKGAFIVATNASWGIDNANPDNYPIWCDFYDELGSVGILNCGATQNASVNIDLVGDMPTACSSDYMIAVTSTSQNDNIVYGYGATTIDLGAPGQYVYTTGYGGYISGTSFASPLVAGSIALLYSADCQYLSDLAISNPQEAADIVRQAIFDGVDPITSLPTVTGGRLNVNNSIDELLVLTDCGSSVTDVYGCTDSGACNYNALATQDNGNCEYTSCAGCTDNTACNYDATATISNADDCYFDSGIGCNTIGSLNLGQFVLNGGQSQVFEYQLLGHLETMYIDLTYNESNSSSYPSDFMIYIEAPNGKCTEYGGYDAPATCDLYENIGIWQENDGGNGTYSFNASVPNTLFGDGTWTIRITNGWTNSPNVTYGVQLDLSYVSEAASNEGCTDISACNYDASASQDNGTCEYPEQYYDCSGECINDSDGDGVCNELEVSGCTDPTACNHNTAATEDDGSCTYAQQYYNCNGECLSDIDQNGICDEFECTSIEYYGYTYDVMPVEGKCWFKENLRSNMYTNGDIIPKADRENLETNTEGAHSTYGDHAWCYGNSPDINPCDKNQSLQEYGYLYNWYAVSDERGLCPTGWRVPSDDDWMSLELTLGQDMDTLLFDYGIRGLDAGVKLKSQHGWYENRNGSNESGFDGMPGGSMSYPNGYYLEAGYEGMWWASDLASEQYGSNPWIRVLHHNHGGVGRTVSNYNVGLSVRCVKN